MGMGMNRLKFLRDYIEDHRRLGIPVNPMLLKELEELEKEEKK